VSRFNRGMKVLPMFKSPILRHYIVEVWEVGDPGEMMYDLNFNLILWFDYLCVICIPADPHHIADAPGH